MSEAKQRHQERHDRTNGRDKNIPKYKKPIARMHQHAYGPVINFA